MTLKMTDLSDVVAVIDSTKVWLGSCFGIKSETSGTHVPFTNSKKALGGPRNTLRSTRVLGTPYFLPTPHEEYCQKVQIVSQVDVVHE